MDTTSAALIVSGVYAGTGLLFASVFVTVGVARIDPAAARSPIAFRAMIAPGAAALWPWLLWKWGRAMRSESAEQEP